MGKFTMKTCCKCQSILGEASFLPAKSIIYQDRLVPICTDCLEKIIKEANGDWTVVDKLCQTIDIPFVPKVWEQYYKINGESAIGPYVKIFQAREYDNLGWGDYYKKFKELEEKGTINEQLPGFSDAQREQSKLKWGPNYDDDELLYLDQLEKGIYQTQNVNGDLQKDQVRKLCRLSLQIDSKIRAGDDVDKLLGAYDKLVKIGDFTPKNVKNANDFDSVGEIYAWLEKRGWVNKYYQNVKKDIVDETIANIQQFCQRLYTNEPGIGDEIDKRIEGLKTAQDLEDSYGANENPDLDNYSNDVLESLQDNEEFEAEL